MSQQSPNPPQAENPSSRALLRRLIRELLRTDADFNCFCLDHFPDVHERFSLGMDRLSKVNLLLELADPRTVTMRLRNYWGEDKARGSVFETAIHAWSRPDVEKAHFLRDELEGLYRDRENRRIQGLDSAAIDQQIVAIKRIQRQVPKLQEGEVLADRYRLLEVVGRGGFANVWQAMDRTSRRLVAVKILHIEQGDDSRRIERFIRGARQMQSLDHPHIVRVIDGPEEYHSYHFFVMDYISGGDLSRAVTTGTIDRSTALRAILQIGSALEFAHQRRLIHRDVKPQNIMLDETGRARLTDFDLVWAPDSTGGTRTGAMGTFLYAAPEEMEDASRVDRRVDIYSLAMTTMFVLHGKSLPRQVLDARGLFIDRLDCPEPAKALLHQATALAPEDRPNSAADFCAELQRIWPFLQESQSFSSESGSAVSLAPSLASTPSTPLLLGEGSTLSDNGTDRSIASSKPQTTSPDAPAQVEDISSRIHQVTVDRVLMGHTPTPRILGQNEQRRRWLAIFASAVLLVVVGSGTYWFLTQLDVEAEGTSDLAAKRILQVVTEPPGAEVQVNGNTLDEKTPIGITGDVGKTARIRLLLPGYDPYEATIIFTSDPRPPFRVRLLKAGERQMIADNIILDPTVARTDPDKEEAAQEKSINKLSESLTNGILPRPAGRSLTITVRPWAMVYLDGKKIQQTPLRNYPIRTGNHSILLANDQKGRRETIKLKVEPGRELPPIHRNWE